MALLSSGNKTVTYGGALWKTYNVIGAGNRRRMNLVAICANLFLPWFLFCWIFAFLSFNIHYSTPALAKASAVAGVGIIFITVFLGYRARKRGNDAMWFNFSTLAFLIAVPAAYVLGNLNFWWYMHPYYDIETLNTYPMVNPAFDKGQQLMDAGRAYFTGGTRLDRTKAVAFKNNNVYCAAPIVSGDSDDKLSTYDFWAVGTNCCSGGKSEFHCGEYNNPNARAGLRFVRDADRPFLRLAVQSAEAAFNIKATHPIFFYWVQDPIAELNSYREDGFRFFLIGIYAHFFFNLICVTCAAMSFSTIGA